MLQFNLQSFNNLQLRLTIILIKFQTMHYPTPNLTKFQYLNMLEDCKQIPKNDRLVLRKLLLQDDEQIKKLLHLKDKKRMQVKLRKLVDVLKSKKQAIDALEIMEADLKWKENLKKTFFVSKTPVKKTTLLQRNKNIRQKSAENLSRFNQKQRQFIYPVKMSIFRENSCKKNFSLENSRKNNQILYENKAQSNNMSISKQIQKKQIVDTPLQNSYYNPEIRFEQNKVNNFMYAFQQQNVGTASYYVSNGTNQFQIQNNNERQLFTNQQLLQQCRAFMSKVVISQPNNHEIINSQNNLIMKTDHSYQKSQQSPQMKLKSLLLSFSSQQLYDSIITNDIKRDFHCLNSLFISYTDFIQKLNVILLKKHGRLLFEKNREQINHLPVFPPFANQYESVSMEKFIEFIETYTSNQINDLRTTFLILDSSMSGSIDFKLFQSKNNWRGEQFIQKFSQIVNRWGKWGQSISYWEFYWAKDSEQMEEFLNAYHNKQ